MKVVILSIKLIFSLLIIYFSVAPTHGAMQMGRINLKIKPSLDIKRLSDMNFPDAYPGAPGYVIEPENSETSTNASFLVFGEVGKRITIILPSERIALQGTSSTSKIYVSNFQSNVGHTGKLDHNGELLLFVGATRESIPTRTPAGDYSGNFCVTVMY